MRLIRFAVILLGLALLAPLVATAQVPDGKSELAANAALQYWQAFSQMPTLDKDQERVLGEWNTVSLDDPAVNKLLDASRTSLMYLHRGAALSKCDWGLDYNDGISMLMPHLAKARDLCRAAALSGRRAFEHRNWKGGRQAATSIMVLARHTGRDPVMIGVLVRLGLEGMVVDLVAPYVPDIKASHSQAAAMFEELPPAVTLEQSVRFEKRWMAGWIIPQLRAEEQRQKGAGLELWKKFIDSPESPAALREPKSLDEAIKLVEDTIPIYDDLARMAALPNDQFEAQYPAFKQKTKADHPLAALLLPSIDSLRAKEQRHQARMGMLLAGIAVVEGGPDKLKEIKSPFGPYEYKVLDKGFELKAKLLYEGQPVTLAIGQRK